MISATASHVRQGANERIRLGTIRQGRAVGLFVPKHGLRPEADNDDAPDSLAGFIIRRRNLPRAWCENAERALALANVSADVRS